MIFDLESEEAKLLLNVALMATGQNRFRSAAKILAALERFRPEEASVAVANAILRISMLDFVGAVDYIDRIALPKFPSSAMLQAFKGMALIRLGRNQEAALPLSGGTIGKGPTDMTESMIVEAVRAAGGPSALDQQGVGVGSAQPVADPSAVSRFQAAMGAQGPQGVEPVPFASEVAASWRSAHVNNQGILHRIRALSQLERMHGPSSAELVELQYEVMNLSFQQEVVAKVADKTSSAVQTLVKNQ